MSDNKIEWGGTEVAVWTALTETPESAEAIFQKIVNIFTPTPTLSQVEKILNIYSEKGIIKRQGSLYLRKTYDAN
jgi:hypothetical protein